MAVSSRTLSGVVVLFLVAGLIAASPATAAPPKCFGRTATIVGTRGDDDRLVGTRRSDVIVGRGGNDIIFGRGGRDFICAGRGGFDAVFAGSGNDRVSGGRGFDGIWPHAGDDFVDGGPGFNLLTYEGSSVGVEVDLNQRTAVGQGRDTFRRINGVAGSESDDVLIGTSAADDLLGYGGNDSITAGDGDDFVNSGAGNDNVDGGAGFDFLDTAYSNAGPRLGDDTLTDAGAVIDLAAGTVSGGEGVGDDVVSGIEGVAGTLGDDTITGNDSFNELIGFEGNDTIDVGGPGEPDELGTQDLVLPGPGNDTVTGSSGTDAVDYGFLSLEQEPTGGATIDLQQGTATGPDIGNDDLTSIETAVGTFLDDVITGSALANFLVGLDGSDSINGAAGDDTLDGDAFVFGVPFELDGQDSLNGGPGTDTCVGGETDAECEVFELPTQTSVAGGILGRHPEGLLMQTIARGYQRSLR